MRTASLLTSLCALALAAPAATAAIPMPDPILGTWRVTSTGTDRYPTVYGSVRVTGGPDSFVGTTQERTFLMGDAACALASGRQVWTLQRIGWQSGSSTSIRYEGTSVQPYGDSSIGCPDKAFDAWWIVSLTDGRMSFSMPTWRRTHGLQRVDTTPPRAEAQPGSVAPGRASSLHFAASEESGWAQFTVRVLRGTRVLVSRAYDHVFSTSSGETQTIMWTPPRSVTGPLRLCVTGVDGSGNRSAESCAAITVRGPDRAAPRIDVRPASGAVTDRIRLRWRMGDDSGVLRLTLAVYRPDGTLAATRTYPAVSARLPWEAHHIWFTPPATPGRYRFCVTVRDAGGHRARDCAALTLRRARTTLRSATKETR